MPTYHDEKDVVHAPSIQQEPPSLATSIPPTTEEMLAHIGKRLDEIKQMLAQLGVRT